MYAADRVRGRAVPGRAAAAGAALVLVLLVVGLPVALATVAGNPLPERLPAPAELVDLLTAPDDGSLFLRALAVAGWLAWAVFAASVLLEVWERVTHRRVPAVPGLRTTRRLAAVLVATAAALLTSPTFASGDAAPLAPVTAVTAADPGVGGDPVTVEPAGAGPGAIVAATTGAEEVSSAELPAVEVLHVVARGEGLLDLQERYGVPWERIAEANIGRPQPDGGSLQPGQMRIYPGWQLRIPVAAAPAASPTTTPAADSRPDASPPVRQRTTQADDQHVQTGDQRVVYEVVGDDWMWFIADRFLGDPERYPEIAALNPEYADVHPDYPDHIRPGWRLRLPADAVDRGPRPHATGAVVSKATEPVADCPVIEESGDTAVMPGGTVPAAATPAAPPPAAGAVGSATPDRTPATPPAVVADLTPELLPGATGPDPVDDLDPADDAGPDGPAAADTSAEVNRSGTPTAVDPASDAGVDPEPTADDEPVVDDEAAADPERLAPALFGCAGLLAALVLGAVLHLRQRRRPRQHPGTRLPSSSARLERVLRSAQQPLDVERLLAAVGTLAAGLVDRPGPLPDPYAVAVVDGAVELFLERPCPVPPVPWRDLGDRWWIGPDVPLPAPGRTVAPVPALATVGSQAGRHLLVDLERLGFVEITGDRARALDLLRYLAAELARNTWSDSVDVLLVGFDRMEADLLAELCPERIRVASGVAEAAAALRHRITAARSALHHTGDADTFAGRIRGAAADAFMPEIMLVAAPSDDELPLLGDLRQLLESAGRCAAAVVVAAAGAELDTDHRLTVTAAGVLHARLPGLRASLAAASLSIEELTTLTATVRQARMGQAEPTPPAAEGEPWAAGTDLTGAVLDGDRAGAVGVDPAGAAAPGVPAPPDPGTVAAGGGPATAVPRWSDPDLDDDLRDWHAEDPGRPRIGVLGPVLVDGLGPPPDKRRHLHAELVVLLAERGSRGADPATIEAALWPGGGVDPATRQLLIDRARRWLGKDAGGNPWLADVDAELVYRLIPGYLFDWQLFRRLRTRAEHRGEAGTGDLRAALRLVRGAPLAGADRPGGPGMRNPYPWLPGSDIDPDLLTSSVVDVAHQLAERCLADGDTDGVRWAVAQAWLADPDRTYEQPWHDLLRAEHADGDLDRVRALVAELMERRDLETVEELVPDTYRLVRRLLPHTVAGTG